MTSPISAEALYDGLADDTPLGGLSRERFAALYRELEGLRDKRGSVSNALQLAPRGYRFPGCKDPLLDLIFACCTFCYAAGNATDEIWHRGAVYKTAKQLRKSFDKDAATAIEVLAQYLSPSKIRSIEKIIKGARIRLDKTVTLAEQRRLKAMRRRGISALPKHAGRPIKVYSEPVNRLGALLLAAGFSKKRSAEHILEFVRSFELVDEGNDRLSVNSIQVRISAPRKVRKN